MTRRLRARLHGEDGVSLVELLVAMSIFLVLGSLIVSIVVRGAKSSGKVQSRSRDTASAGLVSDTLSKFLRTTIDPDRVDATVDGPLNAFAYADGYDATFYAAIDTKSVTDPTGATDAKASKVRVWVDDGTAARACTLPGGTRAPVGTLCYQTSAPVTTAGVTTWPTPGTVHRLSSGVSTTSPLFTYDQVVVTKLASGVTTASYTVLTPTSAGLSAADLANVDAVDLSIRITGSAQSGRSTTVLTKVVLPNLEGF